MKSRPEAQDRLLSWQDVESARTVEFDELDRRIIRLLRQDGRRGFADIARQVDVSEPTVRKRVDRLTLAGAVFITAQVRPTAVGRPVYSVVAVRTKAGRAEEVGRRLAAMDEVSYLSYVTGSCDIFLEAYLSDTDSLFRFLIRNLGAVEGIDRTDASQVLRVDKVSYMWEGENVDREPLEPLGAGADGRRASSEPTERSLAGDETTVGLSTQGLQGNVVLSGQVRLDDLDRRIVQMLRHDGRHRYVDIARLEKVSEQTIRNRVERLLKTQAVLITARVNPPVIGFPITVLVRIRVKRGTIREVGSRLATMQHVSYVGYTAGSFDMFIEANLASADRLFEFLQDDLAAIKAIDYMETLQVLRTPKLNYMWEGESFSTPTDEDRAKS